MEQLTGQFMNFFHFSFNSKLHDTNFSNLILILPEVHILYRGIIRFRWNIQVPHLNIFSILIVNLREHFSDLPWYI